MFDDNDLLIHPSLACDILVRAGRNAHQEDASHQFDGTAVVRRYRIAYVVLCF